jgi:hypothetical protein
MTTNVRSSYKMFEFQGGTVAQVETLYFAWLFFLYQFPTLNFILQFIINILSKTLFFFFFTYQMRVACVIFFHFISLFTYFNFSHSKLFLFSTVCWCLRNGLRVYESLMTMIFLLFRLELKLKLNERMECV